MSRALGAAFLSHQVEQLEKTVSNGGNNYNSWRDRDRDYRRLSPPGGVIISGTSPTNSAKRGPAKPGKKKNTHDFVVERRERREARKSAEGRPSGEEIRAITTGGVGSGWAKGPKENDKDADVVVVDASVLVHALHQVKKWCKEGREEVIIIPLEGTQLFVALHPSTY